MERKDIETGKQPYTTPQLRTIELVSEEVLGAGCKSVSSAGPGDQGTCLTSGCSEMAS